MPDTPVEPVTRLRETIRALEREREIERRSRWRLLLLIGLAFSAVAHLGLMLGLDLIRMAAPGGGGGQGIDAVSLESALAEGPELTEFEQPALQAADAFVEPAIPGGAADAVAEATAPLIAGAGGGAPELGGAGAGGGSDLGLGLGAGSGTGAEEGGLGGGGAGTSFFGVSARGTRFAYIVDISGSMAEYGKISVCMRELGRSLEMLPDYASFYVVLYNSEIVVPPMEDGWMRARDATVARFVRWFNQVDPGGGTRPKPAFEQVFSLEDRPDVIYFLTDGLIPPETVAAVGALNGRGRRVAINTIAFGDPAGQELLKDISARSGGVYRFVPANGP
jgi:hypothetical protein